MGIVLFDWKSSRATKKDINSLLSTSCLFDGYLTEPTSYPHLAQLAYLTETCFTQLKSDLTASFSMNCLFDGYLTEH